MAQKKIAILVGGGPAPGINSVIGAATIRSCLSGYEVIGIQEGFKWLMEGDTHHTVPLTIEQTSRIHFRGGSTIGIARANPTKDPSLLAKAHDSLKKLGVGKLITIGGDDTAFSAHKLAQASGGDLAVVHVPKTIDNDLDLPFEIPTFGFQTARHLGVGIVQNLMTDARTTSRWYFVVAMGRKAGHLALGIGKAAGATLSLIPEEFHGARMRAIVDTLVGAILKRLSYGRSDGVAVLAEGLVEILPESDLVELANVERDAHGHIRISEIDFGNIIKKAVEKRLGELGVKTTIVAKNIGYELRCADPIPFDMEYTRDLGYCAARFIIEGGTNALITLQNGHFKPMPFEHMMDPETGRMRVRMVDVESTRFRIAQTYMLRLKKEDFSNPAALGKLAQVAHVTPDEFRAQFEHLVVNELPPMTFPPPAVA